MIITFSNGYSLEVSNVVESKDISTDNLVLSIRVKNLINVEEVYASIKDGLDEIELTDGEDTTTFKGYNKIIFVQNVIGENKKEASIGIVKEVVTEEN